MIHVGRAFARGKNAEGCEKRFGCFLTPLVSFLTLMGDHAEKNWLHCLVCRI